MTRNDRDHRQRDDAFIGGKIAGNPDGKAALAEVTQECEEKAGFSENATDVACPDAAAAQFANVLPQALTHEVITGGKTTQHVGAKTDATGLVPVGRA